MKLCVLDFETTGLDPQRDEIIEVCAVVWDMGKTAPSYSKRFFSRGPVDPVAQRVNGYTPEAWQSSGAEFFTAAHAEQIAQVIAAADEGHGAVLCGAAPAFDRAFLQASFERVRMPLPRLSHRLVDVQAMGVPLVMAGKIQTRTGAVIPSLADLQEFFGLGKVEHTAVGDVFNTIKVFEKLIEVYWPAVAGASAAAGVGGVAT